jgi:hypothetical protein
MGAVGVFPFLTLPLEVREIIYQKLVTTTYCTKLSPTGNSLEFCISNHALLINNQISAEATKIFFQENNFVVVKVFGLYLLLDELPGFPFLTEDKVADPVLRVEVQVAGNKRPRDCNNVTLITTSEGLQSVIATLWKLDEIDLSRDTRMSQPIHHSDLSISLDLNVKTSARGRAISSLVLEPWNMLHGVKELSLGEGIEEPIRTRLENNMLRGLFPAEAALTFKRFHSTGQAKMLQSNYSTAQWSWLLFDEYWKHLAMLRTDPLNIHDMNNANNQPWSELWSEAKGMYFQAKLGLAKTYLHQSQYEEAKYHIENARWEWEWPSVEVDYTVSPILKAKFYICAALARTACGENVGMENIEAAATQLASSGQYNHKIQEELVEDLHLTINTELSRLNSPHECKWEPPTRWRHHLIWHVGKGRLSFWEWLDVRE